MEYRPGKCSSCGAEYKIPASFAHSVAKCKKCGGVVRIDRPEGAAPPAAEPVPASRPKPAPAGAAAPDAPRAKGGMLERLKAERRLQAQGDGASPRPAAPAAKAAPGRGSTLERLKAERAGASGAKQPAAASATAGPSRARTASRRRPRGRGGDEDDKPRAGRRRPRAKKQTNTPLLLGAFGGLVVAGIVLFFTWDWLMGGPEDASAVVEASGAGGDEAGAQPAEGARADEGSEAASAEAPPAEEEPAEEVIEKPEPKKKKGDPDSIDLSKIQDFESVDGTTTEEWDAMVADMRLWMDPWAGADGMRARKRLLEKRRKAMPVMMNAFKTLDVATEEGRGNGDQIQRALTELAHGVNFGWKYSEEPEDVYFNKRVIEMYANQWDRAQDDIEYWIVWTKLDEKDPDQAKRLREKLGIPPEVQDELDELDVD